MPALASGLDYVDLNFLGHPQIIATAILHGPAGAALIDPGPSTALATLTTELEKKGIRFTDVRQLLLTHIHLDHAGATGSIVEKYPHVEVLVHSRGAPHMIDPAKLIAGTRAVYGDELYSKLYGEILPIATERLKIAQDGARFDLAGRAFECVHTPGHALHHMAIVDRGTTSIFTGDTFGLSYREFDTARGPWIMPTTTPTQFDPVQLKGSIARLMQFRPRKLYLTHYSEVGDCTRLANDMVDAIDAFVRIARESHGDVARDARAGIQRMKRALRRLAHEGLREHGCPMTDAQIDAILDKDFELNAAGLAAWLGREAN
jgi:glyoxylase-like metal-dependent hydrolase (beta-lactamase superfamily II)